MISENATLALITVAALVLAWLFWRFLGPAKSSVYFHEDVGDFELRAESSVTAVEETGHEHLEATHPTDEYEDVGWCDVVEGKKIFQRLEEEGVDFYVESPHMDPAAGDVLTASHGGHGHHVQMLLHVHRDHLEKFDTIQASMHRQETEASDNRSLLEAFRSFAVDHDLDSTIEERQSRSESEPDPQQPQ